MNYQKLFDYMSNEHGVTLLEQDMSQIISICEELSKPKMGSTEIIGNVQEHFKHLSDYNFDWKSFYNGWIEGRSQLIYGEELSKQEPQQGWTVAIDECLRLLEQVPSGVDYGANPEDLSPDDMTSHIAGLIYQKLNLLKPKQ